MNHLIPLKTNSLVPAKSNIQYLSEHELNALTAGYQKFFDESPSPKAYAKRGKHWIILLVLKETGARLGEVLKIDPDTDIDYRNAEIRLATLKQHTPKGKYKKNRLPTRVIPVGAKVIAEISNYRLQVSKYLASRDVTKNDGNPFSLDPATFRKTFHKISEEAGLSKDLGHPHILRHSRAIELLRAGVPVTVVQDLLGHSSLNTTAIYLRISGQEAKQILRDRGFI